MGLRLQSWSTSISRQHFPATSSVRHATGEGPASGFSGSQAGETGGWRLCVYRGGATCDKDGNVCFVDQPNNRIMKWTFDADATGDNPKGKLSTFLQPSGYSNGMSFDKDDNLIACADEKNELWSIMPAPGGRMEIPAPPTTTSAGRGAQNHRAAQGFQWQAAQWAQ